MDESIDNKIQKDLLEALEKAKAYGGKIRADREQRLWKKVNIPCSLSDVISGLTKSEMDRIRKNLDLKNISSLKKAELAAELVRLIPSKFKKVIYTFDQGRYDLVKHITKNSGAITGYDMPISNIEPMMEYSVIFPGVNNNQKVLFMPTELVNIFFQIDGTELKNTVRRNTEWVLLTQGMLYYYGVMEVWTVKEKVEKLTGEKIDLLEFMNVISSAIDFYGQVQYTAFGYKDYRIFDAKKIVDEHKMRSIDYYPFTKTQLIKAGNLNYIDKTPEMNKFTEFLSKYYELTDGEKDEIAMQLSNIINNDSKPALIIQYLQSWLEFPSFDFVQEMTAQITKLYNNTRRWALKGYTPEELFQEEKKYLRSMPTEPFKLEQTESKVIDIRDRTKIGSNDPCPCGSGKKYKKCCGK